MNRPYAMLYARWRAHAGKADTPAHASQGATGASSLHSRVAVERPPSAAVAQLDARSYDDGLRAGVQARLRMVPLTPYQRVGLDDFARGFRAGYFVNRARAMQANDAADRAAS